MASAVDPRSWPFAVPHTHPSQALMWVAVLVWSANLCVLLVTGEGFPAWALAAALALQLASLAWARRANARARRDQQHADA